MIEPEPKPRCGDTDPERHAGSPVDDGWGQAVAQSTASFLDIEQRRVSLTGREASLRGGEDG